MRRETARHNEGFEGQGEVIEQGDTRTAVSVREVPLSSLDSIDELLQSGFWGRFKQEHGWKASAFSVTAGPAAFELLVLTRKLFRQLTIAYVPFGPVLDPCTGRGELLESLAVALRPLLARGALFLRFDLPWEKSGETPAAGRGASRLRKSPSDVQPASTVIVDIARPLDGVLESMKPKTRYNIRLAAKKGVEVREGNPDELDRWYSIYQETARRDRIGIHSLSYYRDLLMSSRAYPGAAPDVRLLLALHDGEILAGNIVAFWKTRAAYLYGASSGEKRNLMPTYALQWDAIRRAHTAGCLTYDLYGVPPRPDPGHAMFGLYQFKTGFSDKVLERWGTWDFIYRPVLFALYSVLERARMFYYRVHKKRGRARAKGPAADRAG
jgi:lipid II:glycine glycyltransferase (peptidoglycan interpeptide bridge formation enzyme)